MRIKLLSLTLLAFFCLTKAEGQNVQQKLPEKTRILFLLDASGSMLATWNNEYRIDAAKNILSSLVDSLRSDKNLELGLRVYGHLYFRQSQNCQDSRLEVPFRSGNHDQIINKLRDIKPKGTTPIAYSLEQAANDFPSGKGYRNIIIIITDGIESCDGDPCAVSLALQKKGIYLKPFIIGIGGLNREFERHFSCIGQYFNAEDELALKDALNNVIETSMALTTATVELQDNNGRSRYSNLNVTFENDFTSTPAFDFIHYLDSQNRPDTVEVDPVLSYTMVVSTLPPAVKRRINIKPGQHNHIEIKTPQGFLEINQKSTQSYPSPVQGIMKKPNGEIFYLQDINTRQLYLEGTYEVVVSTLPRKTFKIKVEEGKTATIELPGPGMVNFIKNSKGYGSIYEIREDNSQEWVGQLKPEQNKSTWVLQPGNYKIVFRSENSRGSKFTSIKNFTIVSGASLSVNLF